MAVDEDPVAELANRFPELKKLGARGRNRIPVVQQLTALDCGAACLGMVLGYWGKAVRLDEIRNVMGVGRDGASARTIVDAAGWYGLRGRGVSLELDGLVHLPPGAILHWEFKHFVVFDRVHKGRVSIVDPAIGRRRLSLEEFGRSFTGVALLFEPAHDFVPTPPGKSQILQQLRRSLSESGDWFRILTVSIMLQLFALALPILTGAVVDEVVPRGDDHLLMLFSIGLVVIVGFFLLASMIRAHLLIQLRTLFDSRMTLGFLDYLLRLPYLFFQTRPSGDLMMRVNSNTTIRELLTSTAVSAVLDGTLVGVYLIILFVVSPSFGLLVVSIALLQIAILAFSRRPQRELMAESLRIQAQSESYLVEMLAGIETLKVAGAELRAADYWSRLFVEQLNVSLDRARLNAVVDSLNSALRLASPLIILAFGAYKVLHGSLTLGLVLSVSALANGFLVPLSSLVSTAVQLIVLGTYVERIEDVLSAKPEQARDRTRKSHELRGGVTLDDVSFSYSPASPPVVRDVSLEITPGQFVTLVGPSGAGKSTLASLLLGLYQPVSGRIRYDDVDLSELELRALRRQLGIVTQRSYLFGMGIGANIALNEPQLPLERVIDAAKSAHIHDEIAAMPLGYDTLLLDGGASLSGGQRQRVALARALVHRPAILLLDEATSALDAVTERRVQEELARLACTRIVIAHRLSTIRHADLILVMRDGRIVERGRHDELLALGGEYAALVAAQV